MRVNENRIRILVIDDDQESGSKIVETLEHEFPSYESHLCVSPVEAMSRIEQGIFSIVICDLEMPEIHGSDMLKWILEKNPSIITILLIPRDAPIEGIIRAFNISHPWKCLEKSFDTEALSSLLAEAIVFQSSLVQERTIQAKTEAIIHPDGNIHHKAPKHIIISKPRPETIPIISNQDQRKRVKIVPKRDTQQFTHYIDSRYQNMVIVSEGGSGTIYKADDTLLGMPVGIKVIDDRLSKNKSAMMTLFNEARIAMQLSHKHIVRLHNVEEAHGMYYLVMEYIDGKSLRQILGEYKIMSPQNVLQIIDICEDALGYAHRHSVYHRDIKPDNLMLSHSGVLKIIDFGIACLELEKMKEQESFGTPYYLSPESFEGISNVDQRADIYSFGIMVHELLTGNLPRHIDNELPANPIDYFPIALDIVPDAVRKVLQKSFERIPINRWNNINEFAQNFRKAYNESYGPSEIETKD